MSDSSGTTKRCIACAEEILAEASLCRFCMSPQSGKERKPRSLNKTAFIAVGASIVLSASGLGAFALLESFSAESTPEPQTPIAIEQPQTETEAETNERKVERAKPSVTKKLDPVEEPKTQEQILIEKAAAEQLKTCQALWAHDLTELNDTWGTYEHADVVWKHYEQLYAELQNEIPIGDFNVYRDRMLDAMLFYWQMADLWRDLEVYESWEVWTPMSIFYDEYEILWNRCEPG